MEEFKEDAAEKVEEIRGEAVRTGYEIKKAFLRSVIEIIVLITAMFSLFAGAVLIVADFVDLKYILFTYGLVVCIALAFIIKTAPDEAK